MQKLDILDVKDWFEIADDDLYSAIELSKLHRKPFEIICYHCSQAVEKYLKGFLEYNNVPIEKTHDLVKLISKCISLNPSFNDIRIECVFINRFISQVRYQSRGQIIETDMEYCLKYAEKINLKIINLSNLMIFVLSYQMIMTII